MKKLFIAQLFSVLTIFGGMQANETLDTIDLGVAKTIERVQNLPGVSQERLQKIRPLILAKWQQLVKEGSIEVTAPDAAVRPLFVSLQSILESVLASQMDECLTSLVGVIHTPMPATPLCTRESASTDLVSEEVFNDPLRIQTVNSRIKTLRQLLKKNAQLYIAYPKDALAKRTLEQQAVYATELATYPHDLFDCPLNCASLDPEFIGALYLFKNRDEEVFAFSIQMTQANDPKELGHYGIWFGPVDHPTIQKRIATVSQFLQPLAPLAIPFNL